MNDLLKQSNKWKQEATKLLGKSGLENILKKFGEVEFTGSYAADLMLGGDGDVAPSLTYIPQ